MKTLLFTLLAALLVTVPAATAFAQEIDDVFFDDGGMIDEPSDESDEPAAPAPVAKDEPGFEEPVAAPEETPAKPTKPEKVVKAEPKKAPKPGKASQAARKTASREGFRTTSGDCKMHKSPSASSPVLLTVAGARKLWVEERGDGWVKAFRKSGHGYLSRDCFE